MKFVLAQMEHETNTFSPLLTPWKAFGPDGPYLGKSVQKAMMDTRTPIGAFLDVAKAENLEIVTPVAGLALPSGPVEQSAFENFCDLICNEVAKECDGLLLDLHGAMVVSEGPLDAEGELLERLRAINKDIPIGVSLDLHANVTEKIVRNSTVIVGYKTYPHVDMYETGYRVATLILETAKGKIKPVMRWQNRPLLAHTLKMDTSQGAMKDFSDLARLYEKNEILAASTFGGFPMADIRDAGMSTIVVANNDPKSAEAACTSIMNNAWENRARFIWKDLPLVDSITFASKIKSGPVLLIDHGDNCASGGTQDTMDVLAEALKQNLSNIGVGPIRDPSSVELLVSCGIGAVTTINLGGKTDMPTIDKKGEPLRLTGKVKKITSGEYIVTGPQFNGMRMFMGRTVLFETKDAEIVITEKLQEPWDIGVFSSAGLNPSEKQYLILKSRMYFRPVFDPIAKEIVYCKGVGVTSSDYTLFKYKNIRRPIYPLDTFD